MNSPRYNKSPEESGEAPSEELVTAVADLGSIWFSPGWHPWRAFRLTVRLTSFSTEPTARDGALCCKSDNQQRRERDLHFAQPLN